MQRSVEELKTKIEDVKYQIDNVEGPPCEVYSRICGYYRPTDGWNKGKQSEYKQRKEFILNG